MPTYDLDHWVAVVEGRRAQPSDDYVVVTFPSEQIRDLYLSSSEDRDEEEFRAVLRTFLGGSRTIELADHLHLIALKARQRGAKSTSPGKSALITLSEYDRRVIRHFARTSTDPTWDGLTWVMDLLPHFPHEATAAVDAYLLAHAQVLPDLRLAGLSDAVDLIRSRYVTRGLATTDALQQVILGLSSRDFEFLIARLYRSMG